MVSGRKMPLRVRSARLTMSASSRCRAGGHPMPAKIPFGTVLFLLLAWLCFLRPIALTAQSDASQTAGQAPASQTTTPAQTQPNPAQPNGATSNSQGNDEKNIAELTTHQESDTTLKVSVNLVVVRVVVRDGQGHAVGNLKKEDFELFDNGKPQSVSRFAIEQAASKAPPGGLSTDKAPAPEIPGRYVAYLFDDMHLGAPIAPLYTPLRAPTCLTSRMTERNCATP